MLPYIETPVLDLGFYRIDVPSLLFAAAIVVQFVVTMRRTQRAGIERERASALIGWATAIGLISAHLFDVIVYYPERHGPGSPRAAALLGRSLVLRRHARRARWVWRS